MTEYQPPIATPTIANAPGLRWLVRRTGFEARWQCRSDIARRGFPIKSYRLCLLERDAAPTEVQVAFIQDRCQGLQDEMLIWARGGLPEEGPYDSTLHSLIHCYQTDEASTYRKMKYRTRLNHDSLLRRIVAAYGNVEIRDIKARLLLEWHKHWLGDGKTAMAHSFIGQLRTLFGYGMTLLECPECTRLCAVLHQMKFPMGRPRNERLTAEQAVAIRAEAHKQGWHSVALAQAIQFELMLRQKDVIGEWIPMEEPGASDILDAYHGNKWVLGLRWTEIEHKADGSLILRHVTSKRQKLIEVDLRLAPMVMEELGRLKRIPKTGPVIVSEGTKRPWSGQEFRTRWRKFADAVGVPKSVKNMDSRAGGITEATDAGASLEQVRHAATHSNVATTANYSRGSVEKTADVMKLRVGHRNKNSSGT